MLSNIVAFLVAVGAVYLVLPLLGLVKRKDLKTFNLTEYGTGAKIMMAGAGIIIAVVVFGVIASLF